MTLLLAQPLDTSERFWDKVDKSKDCWEWKSSRTRSGYGRFNIRQKCHRAHRVSWAMHFGEIPDGMWVLHKCDNPACVRPDHLYLGTHADNVHDRDSRERQARGERIGIGKLTEPEVVEIRNTYRRGMGYRELAKRFNVSPFAIYAIIRGKTWTHIKEGA